MQMEINEKLELLKTSLLFKNLPDNQLQIIAEKMQHHIFPAHVSFIDEGDIANTVYFLYQGSARIYRLTEEGEEIPIGVAVAGEILGEMAFLEGLPRSATIETLQEVRAFSLTAEDFRYILKNNADITFNLLKALSNRVRTNNEHLKETLSENLSERTYHMLITLAKYFPDNTITLSQEELAAIVGATRARVTETLNKLQEEGKIVLSHRSIHVV